MQQISTCDAGHCSTPCRRAFCSPAGGRLRVGIMTRKISLDQYDLTLAGAIVLFAIVTIFLVLT
jgi:hypothetical protein